MTSLDVRTPPARSGRFDLLDLPQRPAPATRRRPRLLRSVDRIVVVPLLTVVAVVHTAGLTRWPAWTDDEGTYVAQAWAVLTQGTLTHYTYWYDHPPLGWLQLAFWRGLAGPVLDGMPAVAAGRVVMTLYAVATAGLLYAWARRLQLRVPAAAAAVLLLALSPLSLSFLRSIYLDTLALPWLLAAFALAASPRGRLWAYAGSGACLSVAILTKETLLVLLPAVAYQVWQTCDRRTRAFCVTAFASVVASVALVYPLYAALKGELFPGRDHVSLLSAITFQLSERESTGSALDPGSGSAALLATWLGIDPWLLGAGVLLAPTALLVHRLRPAALGLLLLVAVGVRPGYLPQPYVVAMLPLCALLAAGAADAAVGRVRDGGHWRLLAVATGLAVLTGGVAPSWAAGLRTATTADDTVAVRQATGFLLAQVPRDASVLVDDTAYVDLVEGGFAPQVGVVWLYKLDTGTGLDPSVGRRLPGGWRDLDYVVSSPIVRSAVAQQSGTLEQVRLALENSTPVAVFGFGEGRVEVRKVDAPPGVPGAG